RCRTPLGRRRRHVSGNESHPRVSRLREHRPRPGGVRHRPVQQSPARTIATGNDVSVLHAACGHEERLSADHPGGPKAERSAVRSYLRLRVSALDAGPGGEGCGQNHPIAPCRFGATRIVALTGAVARKETAMKFMLMFVDDEMALARLPANEMERIVSEKT